VGLDVDADAIAWCQAGLAQMAKLATFRAIPHHPPTSEADGAFDALIAISVFTHLPPEMQTEWMAEWARMVAPGGVILFSVSHPDGRARYRRWLRDGVEKDGSFYYRVGAQEGHPDWYQATFHTDEAAARLAAPHFDVLRIQHAGIGGGQTSVVCRRRAR
jgi:cyclopropane fatty-acyl-phospholipid synthase-like methyltransferase